MNKRKEALLQEAIALELNMHELYIFYHRTFTQDKDFWLRMATEEKEHAALLRLAGDFISFFPEEIIYNNLDILQKTNQDIKETIEQYKQKPPSREEAYLYAIGLESSVYELHYQNLVTLPSESEKLQLFQKLNTDDKDHAERIRALLKQ